MASRLAGPLLRFADFRGRPDEILYVMTDLVRDDVRLREIARRLEALLQLVVEHHIDVDLLVERAVERPRCS